MPDRPDPRDALERMREFAEHRFYCIFEADLSGINGDERQGENARPCSCGFDDALALYDATLDAERAARDGDTQVPDSAANDTPDTSGYRPDPLPPRDGHSDGCRGGCGTNDHDNPPCPAQDAERAAREGDPVHPHPGENHEFRTTCLRCREPGYLFVGLHAPGETWTVNAVVANEEAPRA